MATQTTDVPGAGYGSSYVDSLVWGCAWTGGPVTYYFGAGDVAADDSAIGQFTGQSWMDSEKAAFSNALAIYSSVCNLEFTEAASAAQANIVWWLAPSADIGSNMLGMHEVPDASYPQTYGYFNGDHSTWGNLAQGSFGFVTIIHELGHGMGLAHPHDGGSEADATRFAGVRGAYSTGTYGMNQGIWTTMSYNDGWSQAPHSSKAFGYQGTVMALDIAALQALYGANMTTRTGDDEYLLPTANAQGTFFSCIWDAGGSDTISNAGGTLACTIDLRAATLEGANAGGYVSRDAGIAGGYTIASGAVIENATGGSGNDTLMGNAVGNWLDGGFGSDTMTGGAGDDTYVIDSVNDRVVEVTAQGIDTVRTTVAYTLGASVENLVLVGTASIAGTGNSAANVLTGNEGRNTLGGAGGNDTLAGGAGVDKLTGGTGADVFVFNFGDTGTGSTGRDVITDFRGSQKDRIDLNGWDANEQADGMQDFRYVGSAFTGRAGDLKFAKGVLAGDTDGDGLADFEIQMTGVSGFSSNWLA
ncbi:M10 family metallopeptidase [Caenimonas sp. SL110]|uniref:M10 family metallopeptidase n=1 Tax=Caenimonas sp. SL110 TaxID=1450524 RepID=UPI000B2C9ADD|nr:M10 family metallopeptidase [Caenimonas sp. SL110]